MDNLWIIVGTGLREPTSHKNIIIEEKIFS